MAMIDLRTARLDASAQERAGYGTISGVCESEPPHIVPAVHSEIFTTGKQKLFVFYIDSSP